MAKNIKINNVTYNAVDKLSVPLAAGGGNAVFPDTSDADAAATDIATGKTAYVNGTKITGAATGGGGEELIALIERTITGISNSDATTIGGYAFAYCSKLTTASFLSCTTISEYAFAYCYNLTTASFPSCTTIGASAFASCSSLTTVSFPSCTTIGSSAFFRCYNLTTASFPSCTTIGSYAFASCTSLTTVSFPSCTTIGSSAFAYCYNLTTASFPSCTTIGASAFASCTSLTTVSFPSCTTIGSSAFRMCRRLISLYLLGSSAAALAVSNAFNSTPIGGYSAAAGQYGSIFVPMSLLATYQSKTNWTYFSSRFVGV